MKKKLFAEDEQRRHSSEWLNNSSRFFNKKEQGEPVIREYVVDDIDRRLNAEFSFKALLCNPLWQLIDNTQPSAQSIKEVLGNLPVNYVNLLFKEDAYGNLIRKKKINGRTELKLMSRTDIHALTCWIAFCLESTTPENTCFDRNQLLAIIYFLKIGLTTPFSAIAVDFYEYLNAQFLHLYDASNIVQNYLHFSMFRLSDGNQIRIPMRLILKNSPNIRPVFSLYQDLCKRAIQLKLVPNSKEGQLCFYNFIHHTEIQKLIDTLFQADNHPTSLKELKGRVSIFGQH
ncbi:hypothetical protein [Shewanella salipaludis]|uniref:Uncharacterized protein n=1 Tax=Shewanella salipaludis TaxID=2723052 RepID=A0A972G9T2_9GAMM|nr:hypothetical protein [Shewanella salipaludis]NMH67185.1 hypothetical protein [Shewanella salipaludis]